MRTAEITLRSVQMAKKEKVMRKLSWRDSWKNADGDIEEIIYEDTGGDIRFVYDPDTRRQTPYVVDVYKDASTNTYSQIKQYIETWQFPNETVYDIPGREITIAVKEESVDDFDNVLSDLERELNQSKILTFDIGVKGARQYRNS